MYVCGITPYDTTHLGHAFTFIVYDVLIRHLETVHRWPVRYTQNLTDIDDDVIRRARELGVGWQALVTEWTDRFVRDMRRLGFRPPDAYPAATGAIPAIVAATDSLLRTGAAYAAGGSVYLRVASVPDPGAGLVDGDVGVLLDLANERGNRPGDPDKEHPLDAVLWQAAAEDEPAWRSPWGPGRPGWHVECAAMAHTTLGDTVDIHGGGDDLRFPHHACEAIVGSALFDAPWVRFWMHVAMVRKGGEKMAKSLGNLVMVSNLLEDHHPDVVRLYLLSHHYRSGWEWDPAALATMEAWTRTLHAAMARPAAPGRPMEPAAFGPRFTAALDNDLDTPAAIEACLALADAILQAPMATDVRPGQDVLHTLGGVLGLRLRPDWQADADELGSWPAPTTSAPAWARWRAAT